MKSAMDLPESVVGKSSANKEPLADLSWLEHEAFQTPAWPSKANPHNIKEALHDAWHEHGGIMPGAQFGIDDILEPEDGDNKKEASVLEPEVVAKRAMMAGMPWEQVQEHLAARYPQDVLDAQGEKLATLKAEAGLLGNVYLDLSAYDSVKQASRILGPFKTRMASLVVGEPTKEASFNPAAKPLGKTHVASVEYTPELMGKYTERLLMAGLIPSGTKISSKEEMQEAFLGRMAQVDDWTADVKPEEVETSKEEQEEALNAMAASKVPDVMLDLQKKAHADAQALTLAGRLPQEVRSNFENRYASVQSPIMAKYAGFFGTAAVDLSLFRNRGEASAALKTARLRPRYAFNGVLASPASWVNEDAVKGMGLKLLPNLEAFNMGHARDFCETSCNGVPFEEFSKDPIEVVLRIVVESKDPSRLNAVSDTQEGLSNIGEEEVTINEDALEEKMQGIPEENIELAVAKAIEAGFSLDSIMEKVLSIGQLPYPVAKDLVDRVLSKAEVVPADVLDRCKSKRYPTARYATLVKGSKCLGCVFNHGNTCSKQGRRFSDDLEGAPLLDFELPEA